jgi:[protein-PII] uridylyltransferase
MSINIDPVLAPSIQRLRETLTQGRDRIAAAHLAGASGFEISASLRGLYDRIITTAYRERLEETTPCNCEDIESQLAVLAVGGYGRRDLAPYSDVDLLLLTAPKPPSAVQSFASQLLRDLWDIGLKISHAVRCPADCISLANQDLPARTTILEPRLVAGDAALFATLQRLVRQPMSASSVNRFIAACLAERGSEHSDYYAPTVCLLEPNVKKSPGGLRDWHLFRWIALARHGTADPDTLQQRGLLSAEDAATLETAAEFLSRIRNDLHYAAGSAQDVLTRGEQVRLAGRLGFEDRPPLLAVERFMQHYYRQTTGLHDVAMHFIDRARTHPPLRRYVHRLLTRRVEDDFLVNPGRIAVHIPALPDVLTDGRKLLKLFDLARKRGLTIAAEDLERIRRSAGYCAIDAPVRRQFLGMLATPHRLGDLLRALHRVGLLSRLIPAFKHARCLIQFNLEHKYTIDEHSILAVEAAASHLKRPGPVGDAYREIHRKDLLHLALLCHDLGKGLDGDHCETGGRIAGDVADSLGLPPHDREMLVSLVRRHLLMAQVAFRRDIGDDATLVQFAREVATPETLRLLYVHTAADTQAVAPGNWTAWKEALLTKLYLRAMEELAGDGPSSRPDRGDADLRRDLFDALHIRFPVRWLESQLQAMPVSYLRRTDPERIAAHLEILRKLNPNEVHVNLEYLPATRVTRITVIAHDGLVPGIFSKIAGVLAARHFEVITAQIITRPDGFLIDTFEGLDADYAGEPPLQRRDQIAGLIRDALLGAKTVESLFTARIPLSPPAPSVRRPPPRVEIDNDSSDRFTIVEVFADDRPGLLYDISRTLFESGLSVYSARISTHLDQIVDAFYVTARDGRKITDEAAREIVRTRLLALFAGQ